MQIDRRILVLLAVAAALHSAACLPGGGASAQSKRYLTEKAAIADVETTVLGTGALQPLEVVSVGSQASGQVQDLKVELGDRVRRGQLIAVIDPATQQNLLRTAEAQLALQRAQRASQEANLIERQLNLKRQTELFRRGAGTQAALDQAEAAVKIAEANTRAGEAGIRQAEIAVENAKVDLGRTSVVAPIDGVVAAIVVRQGQTVNAVQSAPTLVRLANMDVMTIRAQISEADVIKVHPGQKVYFTILGDPEKRYYSTLRAVEPAPESANSANESVNPFGGNGNAAIYYNALFEVPNTDGRLRAAMTAQVNVVLAEAKGVLTIPATALGQKDKDGLYAVRVMGPDKKPVERKIRVGLNNNIIAQVLDGLKVGDEVIVGDSMQMNTKGGAAVKAEAN